jgi:alpha-1,6-mannosyltransferase
MMATQELVVPKSMPMVLPMMSSLRNAPDVRQVAAALVPAITAAVSQINDGRAANGVRRGLWAYCGKQRKGRGERGEAYPMHVVDITMYYARQGGGITTYLNAKADWLARRHQFRHTILSPNAGGDARVIRLPAIALPGIHGYRVPRSVSGPARMLRKLRPDLVEVGDAGHCAWAALRARRRLDMPVVGFYHSDLHSLVEHSLGAAAAALAARYLRDLYRQFDLVLTPSRIMQARLATLGVAGAVVQPLGTDCTVFSPVRRDPALRRKLGLPPDARLLVYAGRFTPQKKLALLAGALAHLGRPYHLLLIGSGTTAPPRSPQMTVLPFQGDQRTLARLLASCDLLVHPGDMETFGLIAIEAMACGLPVLGTGGAVAELVDRDTGLLVRPDSVDSLCEGIEAMFGRDLNALGSNARRKVQELYDWNRIMPQLLRRYQGLLAARPRALERGYGLVRE